MSPYLVPGNSWRDNTNAILQHMIDHGSIIAPLRQRDLLKLESALSSVTSYRSPFSTQNSTLIEDKRSGVEPVNLGTDVFALERPVITSCDDLMDEAHELEIPEILANILEG
jgi:hypothetical protein